MVSLLLHGCVVVLLVFVWVVAVHPTPPAAVGPATVDLLPASPPLRPPAGPDEALKLAGPMPRPSVRHWGERPVPEAYGRSGPADASRTKARLPIPGGGADQKVRLPRWGDGLTDIAGPPGRKDRSPIRVVYLLDASGSMLVSLDGVKRRLMVDLSRLAFDPKTGRGDYFNVIFFRTKPQAFASRLLPGTDPNKIAAARWIRPVRAWGQTDPTPALEMAFRWRPDHVVILSDGEFDEAVLDVVESLQRSLPARARIITIGYGKDFSGGNLRRLAAGSGGRFIRLADE